MFSLTLLWLLAGAILCLMELFFPTAFIEFMMGVAALLVGVMSLVVPVFGLQILTWLALTTVGILLSRRMFTPKQRSRLVLEESRDGRTLTEIPPGEAGRVLCDGNSWQARCEDEAIAIPPNTKVFILRREGNTLIILPTSAIQP
ncbi:NfeD family protein [Spirulina major CS-329]|nr:NfeD family protein [Spirulina major CS-329]